MFDELRELQAEHLPFRVGHGRRRHSREVPMVHDPSDPVG
jgi:hypothetical protein